MPLKTLARVKEESKKLSRYSGKWVAFLDKEIIAYNKNLNDLMDKVRQIGLDKKVSVFLVPRKDEGPYILPNS